MRVVEDAKMWNSLIRQAARMAAASAANELRKPETQAKLRAAAEPLIRDAARAVGDQHPARAAGFFAQSLLHRLRKD